MQGLSSLAAPLGLGAGAFLVLVAGVGACSAGTESVSTSSGTGGNGGTGGINIVGNGGTGGITDACALFDEQATLKPVNLYIMFDKSSSMAGSKWESAKAGLAAFVNDGSSAGLSVGMRFFPRPADGTPACDQNAYKEPAVPFGVLPENAAALIAGMDAESPNGFGTPMYPALGGALLKGIELATAEPDTKSAVLFVTDGLPEGPSGDCSGLDPEDPSVVADLAATGLAFSPSVVTYVVGLPGADKSVADQIASAGGSDSAILVSGGDIEEEFRKALLKVRGEAIPCEYELPQKVIDGEVAVDLVNVEITPSDGSEPYTLVYDEACEDEGWKYDSLEAPTTIQLCDATCDVLREDLEASLTLILGCGTIPK